MSINNLLTHLIDSARDMNKYCNSTRHGRLMLVTKFMNFPISHFEINQNDMCNTTRKGAGYPMQKSSSKLQLHDKI